MTKKLPMTEVQLQDVKAVHIGAASRGFPAVSFGEEGPSASAQTAELFSHGSDLRAFDFFDGIVKVVSKSPFIYEKSHNDFLRLLFPKPLLLPILGEKELI